MSHGGLPPRRPDQQVAATPRTVQPGGRATQVTNSKTSPLTVQIVNKPGTPVNTQIINNPTTPVNVQIVNDPGMPVTVQDGGVTDAAGIQGYANDGASMTLISSGGNPNGLQLWSISMSSMVATSSGTGVVTTNDVLQDSSGEIYCAIVNGGAGASFISAVATSLDLRGLIVPAGRSLQLVNGSTGYTHRTSAVLIYTGL